MRRPAASPVAALLVVIALVLIALVATACSGSDSDTGTATNGASNVPATGQDSAVLESGSGGGFDDVLVGQRPGTGTTLRIGRGTWSGSFLQTAILSRLFEELGYTVATPAESDLSAPQAFSALVADQVDIWPSALFPGDEALLSDGVLQDGGGQVVSDVIGPVGTQVSAGAMEGIVVTRSWALENAIAYLDDIAASPALSAQFDVDGDGIGDIVGCRFGSTCQQTIDIRLIAHYGWNLSQLYDVPDADVDARIAAGQPTLAYAWSPSARLLALDPAADMMWLSVRQPNLDWSSPAALDPSACPGSPCNTGFFASDIRAVARHDVMDGNAPARALMEQVTIPARDLSAMMHELESLTDPESMPSQEEVERLARGWIQDNRPQVNVWMDTARAAG